MGLPTWQTDNAAILRPLKTDSEALRYAEWWVRKRIYGLETQEAKWLLDQYLTAYRVMSDYISSAYDAQGKVIPTRRTEILAQIEAEMNTLYQQIAAHLLDSEIAAYQQGMTGRAWALDMATRPDIGVTAPLLPTQAIRASVLTPYLGVQWGENLALARDEFVLRIKRSITQSLITGEGIASAQRRLRDELGITTDRRKGFTRNFYRTQLIARTEILRASNLGALATYEANRDILSGWEWVSARDERTCPQCGALDGKRFKFGDTMNIPPSGSHPGCRCTVVPVLLDTEFMDALTGGPRETYKQWASKRGLWNDGGLTTQKAKDAGPINRV